MVENNENYSKIMKKVPFPSCAREGHVRLMKKNEEKSLTTIIVNFDKTQPGVNFIKALTPAFFYWCKNSSFLATNIEQNVANLSIFVAHFGILVAHFGVFKAKFLL